MSYKAEWEHVIDGRVYRMKTPGGWLVADEGILTYVPDAGHDWKFLPEEEIEEEESCLT